MCLYVCGRSCEYAFAFTHVYAFAYVFCSRAHVIGLANVCVYSRACANGHISMRTCMHVCARWHIVCAIRGMKLICDARYDV